MKVSMERIPVVIFNGQPIVYNDGATGPTLRTFVERVLSDNGATFGLDETEVRDAVGCPLDMNTAIKHLATDRLFVNRRPGTGA